MILWASFMDENATVRDKAAFSFVSRMKSRFQDNVLQIEDVEYEELVAGPDCSSYPVAQLIQYNSTMIHHG